jgi:fumarate reductase flavoprotein subunit
MANSLDEIARWIGIEAAVLENTVSEYNSACDSNYDPVFCKDRRLLKPVRNPPFYAVKGHSSVCDAIGGIKINERMEVLDADDNPIPGLFAGGSAAGGWESDNYCYEMSGHALGFALNSGRIAGENMVEYIAKL